MHELDPAIAFVGFGEAGRAVAAGIGGEKPQPMRAYDIKSDDAVTRRQIEAACAETGVTGCASVEELYRGAGLVFCLVTADRALAAAEAAAPFLEAGTFWLDGNSCAPGSKRKAGAAVEAAGGRYVDVAIMAPIHPRRHKTPMLLAGPHAEAVSGLLSALGMNVRVAGPAVGDASAIKMIRSVMVKGYEALTAECLLAARRAGVDAAVLASLQQSNPEVDWLARSTYNLERMTVHGVRRAAEMREVAATLRELGMPDRMAAATVTWQHEIGSLGPGETTELGDVLDRLLTKMR